MLIEHENLGSNFATDVKILGHVNLMKVAGKQTEIFLEQMVVRKVGIYKLLVDFAWVYVYASNTQEFDSENAIKDMRKQGYGSLLYTMVESFIRDVYKSEKIGISLVKDTLSVSDFYNANILFSSAYRHVQTTN